MTSGLKSEKRRACGWRHRRRCVHVSAWAREGRGSGVFSYRTLDAAAARAPSAHVTVWRRPEPAARSPRRARAPTEEHRHQHREEATDWAPTGAATGGRGEERSTAATGHTGNSYRNNNSTYRHRQLHCSAQRSEPQHNTHTCERCRLNNM